MTARRRAQDRARRKAEILHAARAVFAEDGYRATTVEAVAARAEVGKGTIYLYFPSKDALRGELVLEALDALTAQLRAARDAASQPEARLRDLADAYVSFAEREPDYYRLLNAYDHGEFEHDIPPEQREQLLAASNHTLELVTQSIAEGIDLGVFTPGEPRKLAGVLWGALNGAMGLMAHPVRRSLIPRTDARGMCQIAVELFIRGMRRS